MFDGDVTATVKIGRAKVSFLLGGSLGSLGAEGKAGLDGFKAGLHLGVGLKIGASWKVGKNKKEKK